MERDKNTYQLVILSIIVLFIGIVGCEREIENNGGSSGSIVDKNKGTITFNFPLPERRVPVNQVHRIDLSIAKDAFSLYSGYFLESKNVRDLVSVYSFYLEDGEYYYQAGITCSAGGDTCLWDGFPGGQWGTKWTAGKIEVLKGEVTYKNLTFNK